ncbi:tRNA-splicing endonuclease subunit sen54 N-term-domain-containing protein [Hygrophoropsis aurantiaca]|uniref:tRNA-splicing endonuclease subunit sen54 N-term-domain-containing protein n=1 Tax=Hygrophoropsis aurantiaca TaxID=72124 RepID=A0ACB8AQS2_9AGAM|nr:tRNA-splicing endonuclease subunit sen54 N-term-domain-containing protein [Hygrophoropsis aurantiaca]
MYSIGAARPIIPKRGEKDFEPAPGGGSGFQLHVLDRARSAMFAALQGSRNISSKSISYAIWQTDISRAYVTTARGIHFTAMGHSTTRSLPGDNEKSKQYKRLELLPEEALYLIERGAMLCWKQTQTDVSFIEDVQGAPMTVQQAFSEMIGKENLTLEKYQVFAYLRRLGYVVTRAEPPTPSYPIPAPRITKHIKRSIFQQISCLLWCTVSRVSRSWGAAFDWWHPIQLGGWSCHNITHAAVFKLLRFIPSGHSVILRPPPFTSDSATPVSPYKIFYNLYKPSTPFKKSAPPSPDFSIVVIDARTTTLPLLHELTGLFDVLPEIPPPLPRKRTIPPSQAQANSSKAAAVSNPQIQSLLHRLFPWLSPKLPDHQPLRPNPFAALKAGKKSVIIAAVDTGNISFFRFSQGTFNEWPML